MRYTGEATTTCRRELITSQGTYIWGFTTRHVLRPGFRVQAVRYTGAFRANTDNYQLPGQGERPCAGRTEPYAIVDREHIFEIGTDTVEWSVASSGNVTAENPCALSTNTLREVWVR